MFSVKGLVDSNSVRSIPPNYVYHKNTEDSILNNGMKSIPIVDFSKLVSSNPSERSKAIQELGDACRDWGFFMLINHGMSVTLRDELLRGSQRFFDLMDEEKKEYAGNNLFDPIRCGTSFNVMVDQTLFWRDYLKCYVHPHFHSPSKPPGFSEAAVATTIDLCGEDAACPGSGREESEPPPDPKSDVDSRSHSDDELSNGATMVALDIGKGTTLQKHSGGAIGGDVFEANDGGVVQTPLHRASASMVSGQKVEDGRGGDEEEARSAAEREDTRERVATMAMTHVVAIATKLPVAVHGQPRIRKLWFGGGAIAVGQPRLRRRGLDDALPLPSIRSSSKQWTEWKVRKKRKLAAMVKKGKAVSNRKGQQ